MQQTQSTSKAVTLDGKSASPGVAYGPAFLSMAGMEQGAGRKLRDDEVEAELARVDSVARAARVSLVHQRDELGSHFTVEQRRIFDTHLAMLASCVGRDYLLECGLWCHAALEQIEGATEPPWYGRWWVWAAAGAAVVVTVVVISLAGGDDTGDLEVSGHVP